MGEKNSSLTRVQPVFDYINRDIEKLNKLFSLFKVKPILHETEEIVEYRFGEDEKAIKPQRDFLKWCIAHPLELNREKYESLKNSSSITDKKRYALYGGDETTKNEALCLLEQERIPQTGWYIFEGYTHPDIYIETEDSIFVGEAKRTEDKLTTSTCWKSERDQLIRHIDAVFSGEKKIYSFFIFETPEIYGEKLDNYYEFDYYKKSLPHRSAEEIKMLMNTYIGYTTWYKINKLFNNEIEYLDVIK